MATVGLAVLLAGCGGGSSGEGSQSPDPVVVDTPIAYIKRPLPADADNPGTVLADDILQPAAFNPGAALYIRDRAAPGADELNITDRAWPAAARYDVKDLEVSSDGGKLLFAMRGPDDPDLDEDEQPKWDIWEYELATDTLRRIIRSDTVAQQNHDVAPHYLPDGSIVFSSDRQQRSRSMLLDEGKAQFAGLHEGNLNGDEPAFVLHTMEDDGSNIDQITYNQSHDLQPAVLADGRVVFLRWDRWGRNNLSLYTVHPDGSNLQVLYGFHSQDTGPDQSPAVLSQPRPLPDGRLLTIQRSRQGTVFGGDMVVVDAANFTELDQPSHDNAGAAGPGQQSASLLDVLIDERVSPHGYFSSAWPFFDDTDRLLVGWSQCRLVNPAEPVTILPCSDDNLLIPDVEEAEPSYGLWIYNPEDGTQLPVVKAQAGMLFSEAVTMEARPAPDYLQPLEISADADLLEQNLGVVHIRSVYDFDGIDRAPGGIASLRDPAQTSWSERPARFLRLIKAVAMPPDELVDLDGQAFGTNGAGQGMREILGYVPVEPDGSVKFTVPADLAFSIAVLDAEGRRLPQFPRHQNWLQVRAGEVLECKGCHSRNSELPHGRYDAQAPSANPGAPTSASFANTVIHAQMGESMAEAYARLNGLRSPQVDLLFSDQWSPSPDPADAISISYADLQASGLTAPTLPDCIGNWTASCRVTINYLDHIQPIWELPRINAAMEDRSCLSCHQPRTDAGGAPLVPAGQLDLRALPADNNAFRVLSYQELLANDNQQTVDENGNIVDVRLPRLDENGDPVLDLAGNPVTDPITVRPPMSASGAANSADIADSSPASGNDFFSWFEAGASHAGDLTEAELKLISEWLDIGAQYYNNPFDAPSN